MQFAKIERERKRQLPAEAASPEAANATEIIDFKLPRAETRSTRSVSFLKRRNLITEWFFWKTLFTRELLNTKSQANYFGKDSENEEGRVWMKRLGGSDSNQGRDAC